MWLQVPGGERERKGKRREREREIEAGGKTKR